MIDVWSLTLGFVIGVVCVLIADLIFLWVRNLRRRRQRELTPLVGVVFPRSGE
jgi:UDP-N-acetylmuramyl pentapeptide phosphotransferase/UDP-N-acetylglucosamine-1-phosphate transferase